MSLANQVRPRTQVTERLAKPTLGYAG